MATVPLRNRIRSTIGGLLRRRLIRAKDRFLQRAYTSCREVQQETLARILKLNQDSQFSTTHQLEPTLSIQDFQKRIPVTDYEFFRPAIERMQSGNHRALLGTANKLLMYAVTSGTTAKSKLIPVTQQFVSDYRRGWQLWGMGLFEQHPRLSILRMVQLSSAHDRWRTDDGTPCGNISGLASTMQKRIVRKLYTIPAEVAAIQDNNAKQLAAVAFALADPFVGAFVTANPSTLLQLMVTADEHAADIIRSIHDGNLSFIGQRESIPPNLSRQFRRQPRRARQLEDIVTRHGRFAPAECWPELLCLGVWSGGSAGAFVPQLKQKFGNIPVRDHGLHASEGRMTLPIADETSAGVLDIESQFFEFLPYKESGSEQPVVLQAHELEVDAEYFILLTNCAGLYRYNMFDVVRCVGFHGTTPLLEFLHKGAHFSSITGEKITESQVVAALQTASSRTGIATERCTLTPYWNSPPGYRLYIEHSPALSNDQVQQISQQVDKALTEINCEYQEKRASARLGPIVCELLTSDDWNRFTSNRLASSGGSPEQYKHPFLLPDSQFENRFQNLLNHANKTDDAAV